MVGRSGQTGGLDREEDCVYGGIETEKTTQPMFTNLRTTVSSWGRRRGKRRNQQRTIAMHVQKQRGERQKWQEKNDEQEPALVELAAEA